MIVSMKSMSLAFETDIGTFQNIPSPVAYIGYVLNVGTCVFGPWVSYKDYLALYSKPIWVSCCFVTVSLETPAMLTFIPVFVQNTVWVCSTLTSTAFAFVFLSISSCWSHWLIPDDSWR